MSRVYGYIRASTDKQAVSPAVQKATILDYCKRNGLAVDGWFADPDTSGAKDLYQRPDGRKLCMIVRRGDSVVCAKLDRLCRCASDFLKTLDAWTREGVTTHVCDFGKVDPADPLSKMIVSMLAVFAEFERNMIASRTREALAIIRSRGDRYTYAAPYGWRWERRYNSRTKKHDNILFLDAQEQAIMKKIVELDAAGKTTGQIGQYLAYTMRVKPRKVPGVRKPASGDWSRRMVLAILQRGLRLRSQQDTPGGEPRLPPPDEIDEVLDEIDMEAQNDDDDDGNADPVA